jgi:CDP-glucose 4,6-dehydratase
MVELKNFYKNKKILITGVTGFKGAWLASWLLLLGANIYGIASKKKKKQPFL